MSMETGIVFNANDNTQSAISSIVAGLTGMGAMGATVFQGMLQQSMATISKIKNFSWEITQLGATAEAMQGKFDMVFRSLGGGVTTQLVEFGQAAGRSKFELMRMAAEFQDTLVPMGFARDEAAEMSVAMTKLAIDLASFNDISDQEAFVRLQGGLIGNVENLLKFGVVANVAQIEQYALNNALWDGQGVLDPLTKAQAIYQMTVAQTADAQNDAILTAWQFNNTMKALESVFSELKTEMGMRLIPEFGNFLNVFKALIPGIQQIGAGFAGTLGNIMGLTHKFITGFINALLGMDMKQLSVSSKEWGNDLIVNFAKGMAEATKYIIQVLQFIGSVITSWLIPHSPPKILPDIDKWGADTMMEYIKGFGQADLSLFDNIAKQVSEYINQAMPNEDELDKLNINERITLSRQIIAENINAITQYKETYFEALSSNSSVTQYLAKNIQDLSYYSNKMAKDYEAGMIASIQPTEEWNNAVQTAIQNISQSAGGLSVAYEEYLQVLFNSEYATSQVALAQEELNQVTQHFSELLAPLNAELKGINDAKQAIRDQQRLEQLQSVLADETKTAQEKELAALEIRGMEIEKQIKSVENEASLAAGLAQEKLNAAITQQQKFEEELKIKQQILGVGKEQNNLFSEQEKLLDSIAEKMEKMSDAVGKAAKGLGDAGQQIAESMQDLTDWGKAPEAISVFQETFDEIDVIFEDLSTEAVKLGDIWGKLFKYIGDNAVVVALTSIWNVVSDLKTGFDDLVRRVGIFQTLMSSDSVMQSIDIIKTSLGDIFSNIQEVGLSQAIENELPAIEEAVNTWLVDFARNFDAVFNTNLGELLENNKSSLDTLFDAVLPAAESFEKIWIRVKQVFSGFMADIRPQLDEIGKKFQDLSAKLGTEKWNILKDTLNLIGGIIAGVVVGALTLLFAAIDMGLVVVEGFIDIFTLMLERYREGKQDFENITKAAGELWDALTSFDLAKISEAANNLGVALYTAMQNNSEYFVKIGNEIISTIAEAIWAGYTTVVDTLARVFGGFTTDDVSKIYTALFDVIKIRWAEYQTYLGTQGESIKAKFMEHYNSAKTWLYDNFGWLWEGIKDGWNQFTTMLSEFGTWFIETVTSWYNKIAEWISSFTEADAGATSMATSIRATFEGFKAKFFEIVESLKNSWNSFKETLRAAYDDTIKPKITEFSDAIFVMWDSFKQKFYDMGMWITGMKDKFIEMVRVILEKIQPLLDALELLSGASQEGSTGGSNKPNPSASSQNAGVNMVQSVQDTLPTVRRSMAENDLKQLVNQENTQIWNITFNQQNVENRNALEDMKLVKTFMGE